MKSNIIYVFCKTFSSDLLFWIVINNLFLSTVKGMSDFNIVLISLGGLGLSILFFPLTTMIVKKLSNKVSYIVGVFCYLFAIIMYIVCSSVWLFIIAEAFYCLSTPFTSTINIILKKNLMVQGKQDDFVKYQSYGMLGYSIVTTAIASVSGVLFNVYAYLPMILSLACVLIGLILALIYKEPKVEDTQEEVVESTKTSVVIKNRLMVLILFSNLFLVGSYKFNHSKSNMLIQFVCQNAGMTIANISILVSVVVLISRIIRILSNFLFPRIYKRVKNKSNILITISIMCLLSNIFAAIGGMLSGNLYTLIVLVAISLFLVISIRDAYGTIENQIIINNMPINQQKQAFVIKDVYNQIGQFLINLFALIVLSYVSINYVYVFMLVFSVIQIFISMKLSKKLV